MKPCKEPMRKSFNSCPNSDLGLFGKELSRGTTLMLNTFQFGACIMVNFEVGVSEIKHHWVKKGGMFELTSEFLMGKATIFYQAGSVDAFEAICVLLIYGLALFPNIDGFIDVNAIRIFLIGNLVPTMLGDMYFSFHLKNSKGGGTIVCRVPLLYSVEIIDSCGEFSNVPLIGTQGGTNYNPTLARRQLGFPLRDKPNNTQLEVVAEPSTLPNQDVLELEDSLAKMKQEKDMWEERFHALSRKHEELQLESKDKDALIELLEDRIVKR
ncbi:hypothetical protein KIW84_013371 [Lathyrus oleraceus]|uniref:DUF7745 domain-containing protein n=1 Tax=Pisum sativum TaxID=3888 RepID=A0A9D5BK05_PEA|nr:hypothetical protein KIW84_013371 [Pisum sativum]